MLKYRSQFFVIFPSRKKNRKFVVRICDECHVMIFYDKFTARISMKFGDCKKRFAKLGELLVHIEQFEKTLVVSIVEANNKLQNPNGGAFNQYKTLLLNPAGRTELENLITSLQQGKNKLSLIHSSNLTR